MKKQTKTPVDLSRIKFTHVPNHYASRTHEAMRPVLAYPDAEGPTIHYYMIRGGVNQRNITVWEPGLVGTEYIKTYGHYHVGKLDERYWIVQGEGIAILQKLAIDKKGNMIANIVDEVKIVYVKPGDEIYMPESYGHLVVNTGLQYFVTVDDSPVDFEEVDPTSKPGHADYSLVEQMQGFAYYIVQGDDLKPALVRNSRYKEIRNEDLGGLSVIKLPELH